MGVVRMRQYETFCEGGVASDKVFCAGCSFGSEIGCLSTQTRKRRRNYNGLFDRIRVLFVALFLWTTCTSISGKIFFVVFLVLKITLNANLFFGEGENIKYLHVYTICSEEISG